MKEDFPTRRPFYFLIAGEASGDQLGGQLMHDLKTRHKGEIDFIGIGGPRMQKEGLQSLFPMEELSIMGIFGILAKLPHLLKRLKQTIITIQKEKPDVVVTIDSPDFSFRVAKAIRKSRTENSPKLIHYVAPTVWAWRPGRAKKIAKIYDELWCLYPFEPPYFEKHGLPTKFLGHPLAQIPEGHAARFYEKSGIPEGTPLLTILPGSRKSEVTQLLPLFMKASDVFLKTHPQYKVILPTVPQVETLVREMTKNWDARPYIFLGDDIRRDAFATTSKALAASGTVALELGLFSGAPFAIAYQMSAATAIIARRLITAKYACMVNILFDQEVIPEFLQEKCTVENMVRFLNQAPSSQDDHRNALKEMLTAKSA
ncbi:Lipid-A-disaccharide synthase [Candidatus Bealeia paramacronuclearis]|uniref:Lipid-A-disaccharide synthase n=1 Tax=Candidatus Bealeia paramacronuclearis TaxID=1921001 RepID=A0ABZ2C4L6_9PROT|nr:Lipid-A-disaccharide synthase [Candidatus Bealeia paramacronuclearis]